MVLGSALNNSCSRKSGHKAAHKHPLARLSSIVLANQLLHGLGSASGLSGTSSSHSVDHIFSRNSLGRKSSRQEVLHATAIQVCQDHDHVDYQDHHDSISIDERSRLAHIRADNEDFQEQEAGMDIHNILSGDSAADISHAGSGFAELLAIEDGLLGPVSR